MGYRNYIGSIPKKEYNKIKSMTKAQLYEFYKDSKHMSGTGPDDFYMGAYHFGEKLYEFGKYVDFKPPKKSIKPFFKKKELKEKYEDYEFSVVTPEFLAYIIENYTNKVKAYYSKMLKPFFPEEDRRSCSDFLNSIKTKYNSGDHTHTFDFSKITEAEQTELFNMIEHIRSFAMEWGIQSFLDMLPYDLKQGEEITTSWKYEYGIFELVRIYKSFDWKKNVMIYYGY